MVPMTESWFNLNELLYVVNLQIVIAILEFSIIFLNS